MSQLNADAIITLVSAIPALLIASLSAWLAYLTLRHRNTSRNDIETSAIEFIAAHTSTTTSRCVVICTLHNPMHTYMVILLV
jgi:hypothetical protein